MNEFKITAEVSFWKALGQEIVDEPPPERKNWDGLYGTTETFIKCTENLTSLANNCDNISDIWMKKFMDKTVQKVITP